MDRRSATTFNEGSINENGNVTQEESAFIPQLSRQILPDLNEKASSMELNDEALVIMPYVEHHHFDESQPYNDAILDISCRPVSLRGNQGVRIFGTQIDEERMQVPVGYVVLHAQDVDSHNLGITLGEDGEQRALP